MNKNIPKIRNFCIIAHIDHGKSTLADRFLEITKTVSKDKIIPQFLDRLEAEREHGITIKMQPVQMRWFPAHLETLNSKSEILNNDQIRNINVRNKSLEFRDSPAHNALACEAGGNLGFASSEFILNLIDTPGHIDFSYEVSRALKAVEGAILLVDATQGIQAQTLSVLEMAKSLGLKIIPVVNKIDLVQAETEKVTKELKGLLGKNAKVSQISAKTGQGVEELLDRLVAELPSPSFKKENALKALIFDANFDPHRGVIAYVRIFEGELKEKEKIYLAGTKISSTALEIGIFGPDFKPKTKLLTGEIGYVVTDLKRISQVLIGDTLTYSPTLKPNFKVIEGFKKPQPRVFASLYPQDENEYPKLRKFLEILSLSDSAFKKSLEFSPLLGRGFKVGALGSLHLKIIQERLEKEFHINTVLTTPQVAYKFILDTKKEIITDRLDEIDFSHVKKILEPKAKIKIITPSKFQGQISDLLVNKRGKYINTEYLSESQRIILEYELPFSQVASGLYEEILSVSSGFASMSYEISGFKEEDLVLIEISIANKIFSPLSFLTDRKKAYPIAKKKIEKIKKFLPQQLFEVEIKAQIGAKIIAKEKIPALRKDVLAKLYGGDRTRKDKLLEKQKAGKKRMKQLGNLSLPSDIFFKIGQEI